MKIYIINNLEFSTIISTCFSSVRFTFCFFYHLIFLFFYFSGPVIFTGTVGSVLTFSSEKTISNMNNIFVFIIIIAFSCLITIGLPKINIENYFFQDYNSVLKTVPIMLVALVFHNIIPVICSKLKYKKKDIRAAVTYGSLIPLLMFITWNAGN